MFERLRNQSGFTMIELVVAIFLTGVGLIAVAGSFDAFRVLTVNAGHREAATHVAQQEVERLRSMGYDGLVMDGTPTYSADKRHPWNGVNNSVNPATYRPTYEDADPLAGPQALVVAVGGKVPYQPTAWSSEGARGKIYRFVTGSDDPKCKDDASKAGDTVVCPAGIDGKRVTVAVTVESPDGPDMPIGASLVVIEPDAEPKGGAEGGNVNPLTSPESNPGGISIEGATSTTYYAYDTPASFSSRQDQTGDHETRNTSTTPDLMAEPPPPNASAPPASPPLYKYSTDVPGIYLGGAAIERSSSGCAGGSKTKEHTWVAPPVTAPAGVKATGKGAAWIPTQTLGGVVGSGKVCLTVYDVLVTNGSISSSVNLGSVSYGLPSWPVVPQLISFPFEYRTGSTHSLAVNHRLAVKVTVDASSAGSLVVLYDHPDHPAAFQFETAPA